MLFMAGSCGKHETRPANLLNHEQMVKALAEIYIAEEKVSRLGLERDSAALVFRGMEERIFDSLGIPDSVFRASQDFYTDHPIEMEAIYAVLVDSLQLREQRAPFRPDQQ